MGSQTKIDCEKNHITQILDKTKNLSCDLFKNPFFLAMSAVFIFGKLTVNLYMGAKNRQQLCGDSIVGSFCIYWRAISSTSSRTIMNLSSPYPLKSYMF